jgi:hypothetical protein
MRVKKKPASPRATFSSDVLPEVRSGNKTYTPVAYRIRYYLSTVLLQYYFIYGFAMWRTLSTHLKSTAQAWQSVERQPTPQHASVTATARATRLAI